MGSTRHKRISELFLKACELDPDEREAFLEEVCAGDAGLRAEVESLLDHDEELVLKTGAGNSARETGTTVTLLPDTGDPQRIGPYRILQRIGEGGMGIVYEAEQETPVRRRVALKLITTSGLGG